MHSMPRTIENSELSLLGFNTSVPGLVSNDLFGGRRDRSAKRQAPTHSVASHNPRAFLFS